MSPRSRNPFRDRESYASKHSSSSSDRSELITQPRETGNFPILDPALSQSQDDNSHFVCTFCWQPQYPPKKPKLVGSSRISCSACWKEILDLSICWVCGEQIVRGEEVVSLGWCFWHSVCFGCLLCGRALPVPEAFVDVEQGECVGKEKGKGKGKGKRKRKDRGVELDRIPLCIDCGVEMEGKSEERILERGLDTVGKFDGGLSRSRLMRISEATEKERKVDGLSMRWVSPLVSDGYPVERQRKRSKLGKKRADALSDDETLLIEKSMSWESIVEDNSVDSACERKREEREELYLSILNPLREPAFKPSKTKPLPKWMSLLPSNRIQDRNWCPPGRHSHSMESPSNVIEGPILEFPAPEPEQTPIAEILYPSLGPSPNWSPTLLTDIKEIIIPKPAVAQIESLEKRPAPASPKIGKSLLEVILPPRPAPEQIKSLTKRPPPAFPTLRNKALSLPASSKRKNPFVRAGSMGNPLRAVNTRSSSVHFTLPEKPITEPLSPVHTERPALKQELTSFPFFQNARQPIIPARDSSWSVGLPSPGLLPFKGTPLEAQVSTNPANTDTSSKSPKNRRAPFEVCSAEFLDKYQPLTPSAAPKEKYAVGEVGNIIKRFERRKSSAKEKRVDESEGVKEDGLGSSSRTGVDMIKDGLRKELKSLFEAK